MRLEGWGVKDLALAPSPSRKRDLNVVFAERFGRLMDESVNEVDISKIVSQKFNIYNG